MKNTIAGFILALVSVAVFSSNAKAWAPTCITSATYQAGTYSPGEPVLFDASGSSPIGTAGGQTPYWRWDFNYNGTIHWDTTTYTPQCYHSFSKLGTYTVAVAYFDSYGSAGKPYPFTMSITISQWNWTQDVLYTLYYSIPQAGTTSVTKHLPWFSDTSPAHSIFYQANVDNIDFYPQEGWVLLCKDFGTAGDATAVPRFVLYNKYRGILRLFYWNTNTGNYSGGLVTLQISGSPASPLFTFNPGVPQFSSGYGSSQDNSTLSAVCEVDGGRWCYADFTLAGYDPSIATKGLLLHFHVEGIDTSQLHISGGFDGEVQNLTQTQSTSTEIQTSSTTLTPSLSPAFQEIKNVDGLYQQIANITKGVPKDAWYYSDFQKIAGFASNDLISWIPGLSNVAGILNGFIGLLGGESSSNTANQFSLAMPLSIKGTLNLSGKMVTSYSIGPIDMPVPGSEGTSDLNGTGVYNEPLGIFNILTEPTLRYCNLPDEIVSGPGGEDAFGPFMVGLDSIQLITNPAPGMTLVSKTFAILDTNYGPMTGYHPLDSCQDLSFILQKYASNGLGGTEYGQPTEFFPGVPTTLGPSPAYNGIAMSLNLKFKYFNSTTATWDTVYFLKTYPVNVVADTSIYDRVGWILSKAKKAPLAVQTKTVNTPTRYAIQNYPNPFNPTATVSYSLVKQSRVSVRVYDILGQQVATLADGVKNAGYYQATFDGSHLASGIYFIRLVAQPLAGGSAVIRTEKAMLVK